MVIQVQLTITRSEFKLTVRQYAIGYRCIFYVLKAMLIAVVLFNMAVVVIFLAVFDSNPFTQVS